MAERAQEYGVEPMMPLIDVADVCYGYLCFRGERERERELIAGYARGFLHDWIFLLFFVEIPPHSVMDIGEASPVVDRIGRNLCGVNTDLLTSPS